MSDREELEALRRMAELEAKAGGKAVAKGPASVDWALELEKQKAEEMGPVGRFAMSVGQPMADIVRSGKKVFANVADYVAPRQQNLSDLVLNRDVSRAAQVQKEIEREKQLEAPYITPGGRMIGDVLLGMAIPTPDSKIRLVRTLAQLGSGAAYGAATSPEDMSGGAAAGTLGTAAGMGLNRVVGGVIKPFISKEAQALMDQGIQPTIGQAVGGFVNTAEQKLKSLPLVGDVIRNARGRAVNDFNEKAIQVANPASKGFGDEALTATREALGNKFDDVLRSIPQLNLNTGAIKTFAVNAVDDQALNLANNSKQKVLAYVQKNLLDRSGSMDGETAQRIGSDALKAAQRWKYSTNSEEQAMGAALEKITNEWRDSLVKAAGQRGPELRDAQAAWRAFIPVDRAGSYRGNQNIASNEVPGRFTPNSLRRSIEASDQSQFNNATRAMNGGNSPFQRLNTLTRQGERVLGDSVPDSGTATRLMWGAGALGAGSAAGMNPADMGMGAALALPLYSRAGSKFLMQGLTPAYEAAVKQLSLRGVPTQAIDEALRKYGPQGVISLARGIGVNSQQ